MCEGPVSQAKLNSSKCRFLFHWMLEFSLIHLLNGKRGDYKNVSLFVLYESWTLKV